MESGVVDGLELLEWLQTGVGDERDMQLMALEQLCMTLLMSDNIDRCFESCPPRTFLPALGRIFIDESAPENILEVTARAITYYLDVSNECTRRITQVEGAIKAICNRLLLAKMNDRTSKDLAEQCVKLLEHICQREASAVYDAGGLQAMLHLISHHDHLHKDTMHSAMAVITKLCAKIEPFDTNLPECSKNLGDLLTHDDEKIAECALRCFAAMTERFIRRQMDPVDLARHSNLITHLFDLLIPPEHKNINFSEKEENKYLKTENFSIESMELSRNSAFISAVLALFANLCKASPTVTTEILHSPKLVLALRVVLNSKDERCLNDCLRFIDFFLVLLCEGRSSISKHSSFADTGATNSIDKAHRGLIDSIRQRDTDALIDAVENESVDPNMTDDVGQTLLNWCAAFGTADMVIYLCDKGADPNKGSRSSSLHYASCFGRAEIVKILLRYGANPDLQDEEGRSALDKARERNDDAHQIVCEILQNPGIYMSSSITSMQKQSSKKNEEEKQQVNENVQQEVETTNIDHSLAERFIQQLLPIFCTIFKSSLSTAIRRVTLTLIRKSIFNISNESLLDVISIKKDNNITTNVGHQQQSSGGGFVEMLIGVLIIILEYGENNVDAKEQALLIIKSLLLKNAKFWSEQLIKLGVYEKIELLAKEAETTTGEENFEEKLNNSDQIAKNENNILNNNNLANASNFISNSANNEKLNITSASPLVYDRSISSTPSISLRSDSTAPSTDLNTITAPNAIIDEITPSPTNELLDECRLSISTAKEEEEENILNKTEEEGIGLEEKEEGVEIDTQMFDNDLVEAATTIAQALGVQIVEDAALAEDKPENSNKVAKKDENIVQSLTTSPSSAAVVGSDDVWTLTTSVYYRWRDWRLIRANDSLFIWCDAVALELSDGSNGWLRFLMNGRLSTLYSSGSPEYGADNADTRAEFFEKIRKAKASVPIGVITSRPILSIPRPETKPIESGNWLLTSSEANTLTISNKEGSQQKMTIKDDFPGFVFESSRQQKQVFSAESTLGHDFVTGWAARGGGRRLRYFRVEVQRQKIGELAKEIWENYLKELCNRPREAVQDIQKCSEALGHFARKIVELEENHDNEELLIIEENKTEFVSILKKICSSLSDDRQLSIFEISISGLVPALLYLVKLIESNPSGTLASLFTQIFFNPRDLSALVRIVILVLESMEKFPQCLYDCPGGSPFGFQLLTRRLRFRFENAKKNKGHLKDEKEFVDITNRSLKAEPLVTIAALKSYLYDHFTNSNTTTTSNLHQHHYTRPPTAASLKVARKLPKYVEKIASNVSSTAASNLADSKKKNNTSSNNVSDTTCTTTAANATITTPFGGFSSRDKCLDKFGAKVPRHSYNAGGNKLSSNSSKKSVATGVSQRSSNNKTSGSSRAQRSLQQKDVTEKTSEKNEMSTVQQKSMSTTNLLDADRSSSSSASFNQAASAESLKHQTPSLENLLSKALLHNYSIPEESMMVTPKSGSPEPNSSRALLPTFENLPGRFDQRKGSEDTSAQQSVGGGLSIGASSFTGGSQPVLNTNSFTKERCHTVDSSNERLEEEQQECTESSTDAINASGSSGVDNIRGKLGSYTDILKQMMNQVIEGGDTSDETFVDGDEFENDIYDDELLNQYYIEAECNNDPVAISDAGFSISSDDSSANGFVEQQSSTAIIPTNTTAHTSAIIGDGSLVSNSSNILSEAVAALETISQAAGNPQAALAAIRAIIERGDAFGGHHIFGSIGGGSSSETHKRWRQMFSQEEILSSANNNGNNIGDHNVSNQTTTGETGGCARAIRSGANKSSATSNGGWNDEFVLRQQFDALIPAFDPRPGRINVNQTQEVELSDNIHFNAYQPSNNKNIITKAQGKKLSSSTKSFNRIPLKLYLKMDNNNNKKRVNEVVVEKVEDKEQQKDEEEEKKKKKKEEILVELSDENLSLFKYVQELLIKNRHYNNKSTNSSCGGGTSLELNNQLWENTYTIIYETKGLNVVDEEDNNNLLNSFSNDADNKEIIDNIPIVGQALELVRILNNLAISNNNQQQQKFSEILNNNNSLSSLQFDVFCSSKLTQKLCQELADPLVVATKTLPNWCNELVYKFPCFFSLETRIMYLNTTAFGTSRAIGYLQGRRDHLLEQSRSAATSIAGTSNMAGLRREDHYPEYRIGRVKHERIKVHRSEELFLESAIKVLKSHATRKAILEIEYYGEDGTGLGPTLEFFALIAAEFQRKDFCLWLCDDDIVVESSLSNKDNTSLSDTILNPSTKPPGYFVHSTCGLFPAPWPENVDSSKQLELFQLFGVFIAKAIQDDRLVDLPLSPVFLKLILSSELSSSTPSIENVLDIDDFMQIFPEKAKLLKSLLDYNFRVKNLNNLNDSEKIKVQIGDSECFLEDLALTFAVNPPSKLFPYSYAELIDNGLCTDVTIDNIQLYVEKCLNFYLNGGIKEQILAFRHGFNMVFPLASLIPFSATELNLIISGEQCPKWTRDDLLRFTEPKLGYTRDSPVFINFVDVLTNFDSTERKAFLQFTTGCSSLPPGGLANLHPRLTIVRKVGSGDGSYPSVNTCVHYLKLPEYSTLSILRERLLAATFERGFHLN